MWMRFVTMNLKIHEVLSHVKNLQKVSRCTKKHFVRIVLINKSIFFNVCIVIVKIVIWAPWRKDVKKHDLNAHGNKLKPWMLQLLCQNGYKDTFLMSSYPFKSFNQNPRGLNCMLDRNTRNSRSFWWCILGGHRF